MEGGAGGGDLPPQSHGLDPRALGSLPHSFPSQRQFGKRALMGGLEPQPRGMGPGRGGRGVHGAGAQGWDRPPPRSLIASLPSLGRALP